MLEESTAVRGMAAIRFVSATIEIGAALLMLKLGQIDKALRVNAVLGLIGPLMMLTVAALGLAGLVGRINPYKLIYIILGVTLILLATK